MTKGRRVGLAMTGTTIALLIPTWVGAWMPFSAGLPHPVLWAASLVLGSIGIIWTTWVWQPAWFAPLVMGGLAGLAGALNRAQMLYQNLAANERALAHGRDFGGGIVASVDAWKWSPVSGAVGFGLLAFLTLVIYFERRSARASARE